MVLPLQIDTRKSLRGHILLSEKWKWLLNRVLGQLLCSLFNVFRFNFDGPGIKN